MGRVIIEEIDCGNADHMGEVARLADLPHNCILNKVRTGCGGTSVALRNNQKYVIAVPNIELISSKIQDTEKYNKGLPVDRRVKVAALSSEHPIKTFITAIRKGATKVMVTYDSLHKVYGVLGEDAINWRLLVDEYHLLLHLEVSAVRTLAAPNIRAYYNKFKSYCFMSATVVDERYDLDYLQNMNQYNLLWRNYKLIQPIDLRRFKVESNLSHIVTQITLDHLEGRRETNAHIFINSVDYIVAALHGIENYAKSQNWGDLSGRIRVIAAKSERNDVKFKHVKKYIKNIVKRDGEPDYKINFYTSTAFIGVDIYDTDGVTYLVSDGRRDHTLYSVTDMIPQMDHRIRDTKYPEIYQYFTVMAYDARSEAQMEAHCADRILRANKKVAEAGADYFEHKLLSKGVDEFEGFIRWNPDTKKCIAVPDARKSIMSRFLSRDKLYSRYKVKDGLQLFLNEGRDVLAVTTESDIVPFDAITNKRLGKRSSFKELSIKYYNDEDRKEIGILHPILKKYYDFTGFTEEANQRLANYMYSKNKISLYLLQENKTMGKKSKVRGLLKYKPGQRFSLPQVKGDLDRAFDELGLTTDLGANGEPVAITASLITAFYLVKACKVPTTNADGVKVLVHGYTILAPLLSEYRALLSKDEVIEVKSYATSVDENGEVDLDPQPKASQILVDEDTNKD